MADPLLTTLCPICHVSVPKYRCPRCDMRTCSLPCIKKHRVWSACSGQRDPTAYIPRRKLRTAAGIDHDYNFLHGIELSMERSEKLLIEEKGLVQQEELRPLTMQQVRWRTGRDGKRRKVLVTQVLREARGRRFQRGLAQKLRKLNVQVVCAPLGMSRQRENKTTLNGKTGRINWQVEWLTLTTKGRATEKDRALHKVLDDVPLFAAYFALLDERERARAKLELELELEAPKKQARSNKSSHSGHWHGHDCVQDAVDGTWISLGGGAHVDEWPAEKDRARRERFRFYLGGEPRPSDPSTRQVWAVNAGDCLRDILSNARVLEFPTIYVLESGDVLPRHLVVDGHSYADAAATTSKRKGESAGPPPAKRRKQQQQQQQREFKQGQVVSDEDESEDEDEGAEGFGLEAGEIIAEQSLGEEEDDDDNDTGSSGSDTTSDGEASDGEMEDTDASR